MVSFDHTFDRAFTGLDALPQENFGEGKKAVVMGGGTGAPVSIRALLSLGYDTSAIVAMADDGGSTGVLRRHPGVTPAGDIRKCLVAFANDADPLIMRRERLFRMRLNSPGNHVVGNLILGGFERKLGSFQEAITACENLLQAKGHVLPSTFDKINLVGTTVMGAEIMGQAAICHAPDPMKSVRLESEGEIHPNPAALQAIAEADLIVIGPGSLFTSMLPNFLVPGIAEAVRQSRAKVVFVCSLADAQGETRGMNVGEYVAALEAHGLAGRLDAVIVNEHKFGNGQRSYLAHDTKLDVNVYSVGYTEVMLKDLQARGIQPILRPLADAERVTWHNPVALRNALREVEDVCRLP